VMGCTPFRGQGDTFFPHDVQLSSSGVAMKSEACSATLRRGPGHAPGPVAMSQATAHRSGGQYGLDRTITAIRKEHMRLMSLWQCIQSGSAIQVMLAGHSGFATC
jgi:hypothetical protein